MKQYVDRLSGEPARRQAYRSRESAITVEAFMDNKGLDRFLTDHGEASYGNNFLADMVKTDDFWALPFFEVTTYCVTNLARQLGNRVCFGKNRFSERARDEASLGSLFA